MLKKILLGIGLLVLILVLVEMIGLVRLKMSVESYAQFWKNYPTNGMFVYVVLGDSGAQGVGASKPERGYVGLLARHIEQATGKTVRIVNISVSGANIDDVIAKQLPQLKVYRPDLITVEVGSNDITHDYNPQTFQAKFNTLTAMLPSQAVVANIPYFGGIVRKNGLAIEANQYIAEATIRHNLKLANLQTTTKQRQSLRNYSADFFHPNDRGYHNWADAFWKVIEPTIKQ